MTEANSKASEWEAPAKRERVALLHGLGRSRGSMTIPLMLFRVNGFETLNVRYPSRSRPIEELARIVADRLPADTVTTHFFTHSLGGIVLRYLIRKYRPANLGRVVMLAPPNRGSELARVLDKNPIFRVFMGPSAKQVALDADGLDDLLGPVDFELGVITGTRRLGPISGLMASPNDGIVAVEETKIEGIADTLIVNRGHTFVMNDPAVVAQAAYFFRRGRFRR